MVACPRFTHGDTCKCPPYTSLLGAIIGNGNQLFLTYVIHLEQVYVNKLLIFVYESIRRYFTSDHFCDLLLG